MLLAVLLNQTECNRQLFRRFVHDNPLLPIWAFVGYVIFTCVAL